MAQLRRPLGAAAATLSDDHRRCPRFSRVVGAPARPFSRLAVHAPPAAPFLMKVFFLEEEEEEEECLLPLRQLKRQGQLAFAWRRRRPVLDVERTSERTPAAIVLLHCGVPYAPKLPGPRYPPGTGAGCGSSLAWWNRLTTTLSGALRLS